jgi:hypothetical protein
VDFRPLFGVLFLGAVALYGAVSVVFGLLRKNEKSRARLRNGIVAIALSGAVLAVWAGVSALD